MAATACELLGLLQLAKRWYWSVASGSSGVGKASQSGCNSSCDDKGLRYVGHEKVSLCVSVLTR